MNASLDYSAMALLWLAIVWIVATDWKAHREYKRLMASFHFDPTPDKLDQAARIIHRPRPWAVIGLVIASGTLAIIASYLGSPFFAYRVVGLAVFAYGLYQVHKRTTGRLQ